MLSAAKSKIAPIVAGGENLCGYYNGTPSIRPASGRENLVVLTVVLLTGFTKKRMCFAGLGHKKSGRNKRVVV